MQDATISRQVALQICIEDTHVPSAPVEDQRANLQGGTANIRQDVQARLCVLPCPRGLMHAMSARLA